MRCRISVLSDLIIRPAEPIERAQLEALQRRASLMWQEDRDALLADPDAISLPAEQIAEGCVWVAALEGHLVGFHVVLPRANGASELEGLFVEPQLWGKGIGRLMLTHAETRAHLSGAARLHVLANPRAAGFYIACGYRQLGFVQMQLGPALELVKDLPDRL